MIAFTIVVATVILLLYILYYVSKKPSNASQVANVTRTSECSDDTKSTSTNKQSSTNKSKKTLAKSSVIKVKETTFKHKWLSTTLKAHSDTVTGIDFSSNGKYLLSCGVDRALFMWSTKEFECQQHKHIRANVEFDNAYKVRFSPDSRSFIACLGVTNTVRAFKIVKKDDSSNLNIIQAAIQDFPQNHKSDVISVGLSCKANFIMTCSKDTTIVIWDLKGDVLGTVDTRQMNNNYAAVSPCGRFFGCAGFTPDVKVWEVCFDKSGQFKEIRRAFELKGHSAGVHSFSYNTDTTKMASVSKDLTWKLWNTNIDYVRGEEAKCLLSVSLDVPSPGSSHIAISPDSYCVAVSVNSRLSFYNGLTGACDETIDDVCHESINEMAFSNDNKYLALACDRQVKIFHNVTGKKTAIEDLKASLKNAKTQAAKERMQQQIDDYKKSIEHIEEESKVS